MRVGVIGTGHVGLVTGGAMAFIGHDVVGVDSDPVRIGKPQDGTMPFYERVVVGADNEAGHEVMRRLYAPCRRGLSGRDNGYSRGVTS